MGRDKAWMQVNGTPLIQRVIDTLQPHFAHVSIVANDPAYESLGLPRIPDALPERCALTGIHAALMATTTDWCFITACDMPAVSIDLVRRLAAERPDHDLVAPESPHGVEPLHALYSRACLPAIEKFARDGQWKASDLYRAVRSRLLHVEDPTAFRNVNTPKDFDALTS